MADSIDEKEDSNDAGTGIPADSWPAALAALASARIAIISAESRNAVGSILSKIVWAAVAALCALFAWITLLAGLIGFVPQITALDWFHVAFILAGIHLLIILIAVILLKKKSPPVFEVTKAEFMKDKQWLSSVNKEPNSRH